MSEWRTWVIARREKGAPRKLERDEIAWGKGESRRGKSVITLLQSTEISEWWRVAWETSRKRNLLLRQKKNLKFKFYYPAPKCFFFFFFFLAIHRVMSWPLEKWDPAPNNIDWVGMRWSTSEMWTKNQPQNKRSN